MKNLQALGFLYLLAVSPVLVKAETKVSIKRVEKIQPPMQYSSPSRDGQWLSSSSDGRKFVAMSFDSSAAQNNSDSWLADTAQSLYLYDLNLRRKFLVVTTVNREADITHFQISRDGAKVFYTAYTGSYDMFLYDTASRQTQSLYYAGGPFARGFSGYLKSAQMSPDGKYVAYTVSGQINDEDQRLYSFSYLINLENGETVELRNPEDSSSRNEERVVSVSDEGQYVVLIRKILEAENEKLLLLNTATNDVKEIDRIPNNMGKKEYGNFQVSSSRDGKTIGFIQYIGTQSDAYVYQVDSDAAKRLTCPQIKAGNIYNIDISDNGRVALGASGGSDNTMKIAVFDNLRKSCRIFQKSTKQPGRKLLSVSDPVWSGDGLSLFYNRTLADDRLNFNTYRADLMLAMFN